MVADTFRQPIQGVLFGAVPVPHLVSSRAYREAIEGTHMVLSYALLALVIVHVASALRHHFGKKNRVLLRMWQGG
jgi:cytochrome b561